MKKLKKINYTGSSDPNDDIKQKITEFSKALINNTHINIQCIQVYLKKYTLYINKIMLCETHKKEAIEKIVRRYDQYKQSGVTSEI